MISESGFVFSDAIQSIVFVGGPSGSGKSSLVRELGKLGSIYIENAPDNPFLMSYLCGEGPLNAYENQRWFLNSIVRFLCDPSRKGVLIIDQHLPGITSAYTRLFEAEGLVSSSQAAAIMTEGESLLSALYKRFPVLTVHLTASTPCLWARISARDKQTKLSFPQLEQVNILFQALHLSGSVLCMNSEVLDLESESQSVESWIKGERGVRLSGRFSK